MVTNDDLLSEFGIESKTEWIVKRTGIEQRRFAAEGVGSSEMAEYATRSALEAAGLEADALDAIVFATLSPDFQFPGCGVLLQHRLGLTEGVHQKFVPCLDVRNQCSGFLYGLSVANAWIRSEVYKHVLVVGAETHSHAMDFSKRGRSVASLFGDGSGAVVVSATEQDRGVRGVWLGANGQHAEVLAQKVWDIRRRPFIPVNEDGHGQVEPKMLWAQMDGRQVFRHAVKCMSAALVEACEGASVKLEDIDLFFFHQANMRINEYVAKSLGLPPEKVPHNIQRYGNTTAATLPILMAEAEREGRLRPGTKIALAAFGSGFTWGSAVIDW